MFIYFKENLNLNSLNLQYFRLFNCNNENTILSEMIHTSWVVGQMLKE